jgi:hypothetical protein
MENKKPKIKIKMSKEQKVTTRELLRHSFSTMISLKTKSISVEEAKAQASLLKQSNNLLKYELDRAIAEQTYEDLDIREIEG